MIIDKPYSQACENNKKPILEVLKRVFADKQRVLEIGSGTGQHAVYFAAMLPHLEWHTADQLEYHDAIHAWMKAYPSDNLHPPVRLRLPDDEWPQIIPHNYLGSEQPLFDAYFTANTAHIMQKAQVIHLMKQVNKYLPSNGFFCQYGPFLKNGKFSSQSNAEFHQTLVASGRGGYRDISELECWAPDLSLIEVIEMPAYNLMLVWQKMP
jgi:hypothetical protein